jgi:hypothetical protein
MEGFTGERSRNRSIRTDQPKIEAQLLRDRQREGVAAARDQHDFNALIVSLAKSCEIAFRNLKLRVQQSAVNIGG